MRDAFVVDGDGYLRPSFTMMKCTHTLTRVRAQTVNQRIRQRAEQWLTRN